MVYKGTTFQVTPLHPQKLHQQLDSTHNPFHQKKWGSTVQNFQITCNSNLDQIHISWSKPNFPYSNNSEILPDTLLCINTSPQKISKFSKMPRALWHFIKHMPCTVHHCQNLQ